MGSHDRLIGDLAGAILDGAPIDWRAVESCAGGADRALVDQLRLLAAVVDVHRQGPPSQPAPTRREPHTAGADPPPAVWGHLRLLERIGGGTFGDVYRAWDTRLDREVAVKLMPVGDDSGGPHTVSIIREGQLLARVRHPGVVTIYDAQQIGDQVGLWMEFVRGRTLEQRLEEEGVYSPDEAVEIGIELCSAVEAVHDAGLLHRDIKTQNVMRAADGRLVLMDFGVGRELTDGSVTDLAGTPLYLAPEILQGQKATTRTDVYSVGVLLFHILTGSYPVQARLVSDLRQAHERHERRPVRTARPDLPAKLAAVVDRALSADPELRHATAGALAQDLLALRPRTHAIGRLGALAAAAILFVGAGLWAINTGWIPPRRLGMETGNAAALEARDWLLVGAFTGSTGDSDLEATLQQAVLGELERSPHLNVVSPVRVRESLERMKRPMNARVDEVLAREICEREGLAALVTGSVDALDGVYTIGLRAMHAATGRVLARLQEHGRSREEALHAALVMGRQMRERLGESAASIQSTSPPREPVTSESFEAVRHYALGRQLYDEERPSEALPHFLNAVALDPDFAMAHGYVALTYGYLGEPARQRPSFERAAALAQDSASSLAQIEREKILADYHMFFERYEDAAACWRTLLTLRPDDGRIHANLGLSYGALRRYDEAVGALEHAWRSYPHPRVRWMLADMYSANGQPGRAAAFLERYLDRPFDWIAYAKHLLIAGRRSDAHGALAEAERRSHQAPDASWSDLSLAQADIHRAEGRYGDAEVALRQGLARGAGGGVERLHLAMASLLLDWGRRRDAAAHLRRMETGLGRNRIVHGVLSARAGDTMSAEAILKRLVADAAERNNAARSEARVHQLRAEIALARRQTAKAHEQATLAVRAFSSAWTLTTLARAQEAAGQIPEAISTWTSILDPPGERTIDWDAPAYSQFVLAHYAIARLLDRAGRVDEARTRYDEFLRFWDRADPGLEPLVTARGARVRLGQGAHSTPRGRAPKPAT